MRLAGTWKQYSAKAMIQLMRITLNSGTSRYFRWPYQAKVMKMLEMVRSRIVIMRICCLILGVDSNLLNDLHWDEIQEETNRGFPRACHESPVALHPSVRACQR